MSDTRRCLRIRRARPARKPAPRALPVSHQMSHDGGDPMLRSSQFAAAWRSRTTRELRKERTMDGRFDRWTSSLAARSGRRRAIGGLLGGAAGTVFGQGSDAATTKRGKTCNRCPARCACVCDDHTCVFGDFATDPNDIAAVCQKACGVAGWNRIQVSRCASGKQVNMTPVCIWGQSGLEVASANCPL